MTLRVIDASLAAKWFIEEECSQDAIQVLKEIESNPKNFAVPELFFNEMLAVFCKLSLSEREASRYLVLLQELGFYRIGNGEELLATATHLAIHHKISGYDAIYAASAKLMDGIWLTCDRRAHDKIRNLKISECL